MAVRGAGSDGERLSDGERCPVENTARWRTQRRGVEMSRSSVRILLAVATLLLTQVMAVGIARAGSPFSQVDLHADVTGGTVTATATVSSTSPIDVTSFGICVRDASGKNLDFPKQKTATITPTGTSITRTKSFGDGTYTFVPCLYYQGSWYEVGITKNFVVGGPTAPAPPSPSNASSSASTTSAAPPGATADNAIFLDDFSGPANSCPIPGSGVTRSAAPAGGTANCSTTRAPIRTTSRWTAMETSGSRFGLSSTAVGRTRPRASGHSESSTSSTGPCRLGSRSRRVPDSGRHSGPKDPRTTPESRTIGPRWAKSTSWRPSTPTRVTVLRWSAVRHAGPDTSGPPLPGGTTSSTSTVRRGPRGRFRSSSTAPPSTP